MANRNLVNFRQVTQQAFEQGGDTANVIAGITKEVGRLAGEAQLAKTFSQTQLQLQEVEQQFKIDVQSDPDKAFEQYKSRRDTVFASAQDKVSPFMRGQFARTRREFEAQDNLTANDTVFKAKQVKALTDVNDAISSQLQLAQSIGQNFDPSSTQFDVAKQLSFARQTALEAGRGLVGDEQIEQLATDFGSDYAKSFLSGVMQQDPQRAIDLLEDEQISEVLSQEDKGDIRGAALSLVKGHDKRLAETEILGNINGVLNILNSSGELGYAGVKQELGKLGLDKRTEDMVLKQVGFKDPSSRKITDAEKLARSNSLNARMLNILDKGSDATAQELEELNTDLMQAADDNVIPFGQFREMTSDLTEPLVQSRSERISETLGGADLQNPEGAGFFRRLFTSKKNLLERTVNTEGLIATQQKVTGVDKEVEQEVASLQQLQVSERLMQALQEEAQSRGLRLGEIATLPLKEREQIANSAQFRATNDMIRLMGGSPKDTVGEASRELSRVSTMEKRRVIQDNIDNRIEQQNVDPDADAFLKSIGAIDAE